MENVRVEPFTWMSGRSTSELGAALSGVLPGYGEQEIDLAGGPVQTDPQWHSGSARVGGAYVAKFAWSRTAAARVVREGETLRALHRAAPHLPLPSLAATSRDPALVVTRIVSGAPLTSAGVAVLDTAGVDRVAAALGTFLAELHRPEVLEGVLSQVSDEWQLKSPEAQATTDALRERLLPWVAPRQRDVVLDWCDWTDGVLGSDAPAHVLVHGDLHGHNQLWGMTVPALRAVVDFDIAGPHEAEFDLRALAGEVREPSLLPRTLDHYRRAGGRDLDLDRVMAWHLRTALGDVLWRSEAGFSLPSGGTPATWVDGLAARLAALGVGPSRP